MTERMTRDITARITTMAMPMPFQFRGGPSVLPRSWYRREETHTQWWMCAQLRRRTLVLLHFHSLTEISPWQSHQCSEPPPPGERIETSFSRITGTLLNYDQFSIWELHKIVAYERWDFNWGGGNFGPHRNFSSPSSHFTPHMSDGGPSCQEMCGAWNYSLPFFWGGSGFIHHPAGLDEVINKAIKKRGLLHVTIQWVTAEAAAAEFHVSAEVFVRHQWWTSQRLHQSQLNTSACVLLFPWCTPAPS